MPSNTDLPLADARLHGNETIDTPLGPIELVHSYFDDDASKRLYDEMDYQRACQAYVWSTPLVSIAAWRDAPRSPARTSTATCRA